MRFHDLATIFPLDEDHIEDLANDIKLNGQRVPIETFEGKIIDGRRRWLACQKAGVKPTTKAVKPSDPIAYVVSLNLHRRHLSLTQLAMVAARARDWYDKQATKRMQAGGGDKKSDKARTGKANFPDPMQAEKGQARDQVGKVVGVSGRSVEHATNILKRGTPELIAAVDADKIAVSTAEKALTLTPKEQVEFVRTARASPGAKVPPSANGKPYVSKYKKALIALDVVARALDSLRRLSEYESVLNDIRVIIQGPGGKL